MSGSKTIRYLRFFEGRRHKEQVIRFHFRVSNFRSDLIINLPYLVRGVFIVKDYIWLTSKDQYESRNEYGPQHIYDVKTFLIRFGYDTYMGEAALLLPLFKLWLDCGFLSNRFRQSGRFTFINIFIKMSFYEIMLKLKIAGFGIGIHVPFYEIKAINRFRKRRNTKYEPV